MLSVSLPRPVLRMRSSASAAVMSGGKATYSGVMYRPAVRSG